jgi:hypothetical protein
MPHSLGPILEEEKIDGAISVAFTLTATCHGSCCVDPLEDDSETDCLKLHCGCCMGYMILDVGGEMAASHHLACGPAGPNWLLGREIDKMSPCVGPFCLSHGPAPGIWPY